MQAPDFTSFFVASAEAGPSAPPERQAVAASAFTALINAFFVSLAALISGNSLGGTVIVVSSISIIATLRLIGDLFPPHLGLRSNVRHAGFLAIGLLVYGLQLFDGVQYNRYSYDIGWSYSSAYLLLGIYGIGLTRAWQLLGAKRRGLLSWFSPLNDLDEPPATSLNPSEQAKAGDTITEDAREL
jgi:hypothetical protein